MEREAAAISALVPVRVSVFFQFSSTVFGGAGFVSHSIRLDIGDICINGEIASRVVSSTPGLILQLYLLEGGNSGISCRPRRGSVASRRGRHVVVVEPGPTQFQQQYLNPQK